MPTNKALYVRPSDRHLNLPAFFLAILKTRYYIDTKTARRIAPDRCGA